MRCVILVLSTIPPRVSFKLIMIDDQQETGKDSCFLHVIFQIY